MYERKEEIQYGVQIAVHKMPDGFCPNAGDTVGYATVKRETARTEDVIEECLSRTDCVYSKDNILHVMGMLQDAVLSLLKRGKSVDVLELGVLAIKAKEGLDTAEAAEVRDVELKVAFEAAKKTQEAVKEVGIRSAENANSEPRIESVIDTSRMEGDGVLTSGSGAMISGEFLKVAGADAAAAQAGGSVQGGGTITGQQAGRNTLQQGGDSAGIAGGGGSTAQSGDGGQLTGGGAGQQAGDSTAQNGGDTGQVGGGGTGQAGGSGGDIEETGVFIVPVDAEGRYREDRSDWVKVNKIAENKPKTLLFRMPQYEGKCRIAVRTQYMTRSRRLRKQAIEGVSKAVYEVRRGGQSVFCSYAAKNVSKPPQVSG